MHICKTKEKKELQGYEDRFIQAMDDDVNTAAGIGVLFELIKYIHISKKGSKLLLKLGNLIGLFYQIPEEDSFSEAVIRLVEERKKARLNKDFEKSDQIRDLLLKEHQIIIEDLGSEFRLRKVN